MVCAETLIGTVTDAFTAEPLIGVTILNKDDNTGTVTDENGHYELRIASTPVRLQFSYVGYQTEERVLKTLPAKYNVLLQADNAVLDEVVVSAGLHLNISDVVKFFQGNSLADCFVQLEISF